MSSSIPSIGAGGPATAQAWLKLYTSEYVEGPTFPRRVHACPSRYERGVQKSKVSSTDDVRTLPVTISLGDSRKHCYRTNEEYLARAADSIHNNTACTNKHGNNCRRTNRLSCRHPWHRRPLRVHRLQSPPQALCRLWRAPPRRCSQREHREYDVAE